MPNAGQITAPVNNSDEVLPNQQAVLDLMTIEFQMQRQQFAMQEQKMRFMAQFILIEQQTAAQLRPQRVKPKCPVIELDSSNNKWIIFQDAWIHYKQTTLLTSPIETRNEL